MSALLRPTCGWLAAVLSILATNTGWPSWAVLLAETWRPVSGQNWVTVWPPSTFCGADSGLELEDPPHALSTRPVAVRADRVRATRRTKRSPSGVGQRSGPVWTMSGNASGSPRRGRDQRHPDTPEAS